MDNMHQKFLFEKKLSDVLKIHSRLRSLNFGKTGPRFEKNIFKS